MRLAILRLDKRLPRMRGDRPFIFLLTKQGKTFTPHARGSTMIARAPVYLLAVYPACAGIDL